MTPTNLMIEDVTELLPEGYTMRAATFEDAEAVADLVNAAFQKMIGEDDTNPDAVKREWQSPRFTLENGTRLIFNPQGVMVGYGIYSDTQEPLIRLIASVEVRLGEEDRGIHKALLEWIKASAYA